MRQQHERPYFRHFVIELNCSFEQANSVSWIKKRIALFIQKLEIRPFKSIHHLFKPQGISLVYIISSSHLSIHTWPENNYIHIELLTCSKSQKLEKLDSVVKEVFANLEYKVQELTY